MKRDMIRQVRNGQMHTAFSLCGWWGKNIKRQGERVHLQNQEDDKAGHFNINRRTWWFVFHPCM